MPDCIQIDYLSEAMLLMCLANTLACGVYVGLSLSLRQKRRGDYTP